MCLGTVETVPYPAAISKEPFCVEFLLLFTAAFLSFTGRLKVYETPFGCLIWANASGCE